MKLSLNTTEELIAAIREGKMVILMDDEDRENEGDLVMAASKVTAEDINFMVSHARGLVCLPITQKRAEKIGVELMSKQNGSQFSTNFTTSIEAAKGVTTGISAADRATTIQAAIAPNATAADIVQPGHIFPIIAQPGGVLSRAGHTEAGCDLARLAGFEPAAAIAEIMNQDGSMARRDDLLKFAEKHQLKIGTIANLIEYRMLTETTVEVISEFDYQTQWGTFQVKKFQDLISDCEHLAFYQGSFEPQQTIPVRVQYGHFFRELRGIESTDSYWTAQRSLQTIAKHGKGVMVVLNSNQSTPIDIDHDEQNRPFSYNNVGAGSQVLRAMNVGKMQLMSPEIRFPALSGFGLEITEYLNYEK